MIKKIINKFKRGSSKTYQFDSLGDFYKTEEMLFVGTEYGGWHIPKNLRLGENDICYFAGAGEDISFDCGIASLFPCHINIFDPTPRAIRHFEDLKTRVENGERLPLLQDDVRYHGTHGVSEREFQKIHFWPWGIAGKDEEMEFYFPANPEHVSCSIVNLQETDTYFTAECFTLSSIMERLGHQNITFLKMDIEGAEYQVLDSMFLSGIYPYLLAIEFDELHTPRYAKQAQGRVENYVLRLKSLGYKYIFRNGSNLTFLREH